MKRLIMDLDGTICHTLDGDYSNSEPDLELINTLKLYKQQGFEIVISTSRNMRTYDGCVGKINKYTLPVIVAWLEKHQVPYDEVYMGKPWCGHDGFYVDDKAIRPSEFKKLSYTEIQSLLESDNT